MIPLDWSLHIPGYGLPFLPSEPQPDHQTYRELDTLTQDPT